jgi:geranylgeranyl pyrophosphate synthase
MIIDKNSSAELPASVARALGRVVEALNTLDYTEFRVKELFGPAVYLLGRRGKLVRPALVLMGAHALGEKPEKFVNLAVAAELLHTSSLVHDDIVDGDDVRNGMDSVHAKYGGKVAIIAGDALISKAVELAAGYGEAVLKSMTEASMDMCAGEILDYRWQEADRAPSISQYIRIASLKSASLIGACMNAAAIYCSSSYADTFYRSGTDLGIAFQIRDDVLDFMGSPGRARRRREPNIVSSIMERYGSGSRKAIIKAAEMNNRYVSMSQRRMKRAGHGDVFSGYLEMIRLKV